MASIADIEGVRVPFLHINQLIANKKAVNRPKDQIDVQALEEIIKLRERGRVGDSLAKKPGKVLLYGLLPFIY
ncbi:hypothetical protein BC792_101163 [Sphingobacterium allocomposti]|uniref:Uncharacterized protein n=1 Tax=Sphingobacterium allocomposti TaxID=415956 RepID=A0A5S5DU20_9SPHI|nr:hypothetical protein [Sphingobacterium composti Yoo et al. 2007 non Ten et al. 2007]TYP98506.1 hypothetical protein BC792_101163 [Sphingobacterium composti Yoo et al. 2007 non Ten et al. 2007]